MVGITGSGVRAQLVVTQRTTAAELEAFGKEVGADARLRGKANQDGSVTLYARDHGPGLMSRLGSRHERREAAVVAALKQVNRNVADANAAAGGHGDGPLDAILSRSDLRLNGKAAEMAGRALAMSVGAPNPRAPDSPRLASLATATSLTTVLAQVGVELAATGHSQHGLDAAKGLLEVGLSYLWKQQRDDLSVSAAATLKADVESCLRSRVPDLTSDQITRLREVAHDLVEEAVAQLSDGRMADDESLQLNGTSYSKVRTLAEGGYGRAVLYESEDKSSRIVLKVPLDLPSASDGDQNDGVRLLRSEVPRHRAVGSGGHANVLAFLGGVRLPGGAVGIAMEQASSSDGGKLQATLAQAVAAGHLTRDMADVAVLTLLRDVGRGLSHMQSQGLSHLDLKPVNIFLKPDGTAMVADFGTAAKASEVGEITLDVLNPLWKSPEAILYKMAIDEGRTPDTRARTVVTRGLGNAIFGDPAKHTPDQARLANNLNVHIRTAQDAARVPQNPATFTGASYDLWALGATALALATNEDMAPGMRAMEIEGALADLATQGATADLVSGTASALMPAMPASPLRDLVNDLMRPRPEDRLGLDALGQHAAFGTPGVGTPAARELIQALMAGADGATLSRLGAAAIASPT